MKGLKVMQTTIAKWGNSQGIRLPKILLESANLTDSDTVNVLAENNSIIITKVENKKKHIPLAERLKNWNGQPYELTGEDSAWLNMEPIGEET